MAERVNVTSVPTVAFVCVHGAAKSVIAAAHFQRLADQRSLSVRATAAGTNPAAEIPQEVVTGLLQDGIDVRGQRPRPATREDLAGAWRAVSFGCDLGSLAPPGLTVERWDDVPAVSENFAIARAIIVSRLARLLDELAARG